MDSWKSASLIGKQNEAFENAYATIESRAKVFRRFVPLPLPSALKIGGELAHRKLFSEFTSGIEYSNLQTRRVHQGSSGGSFVSVHPIFLQGGIFAS